MSWRTIAIAATLALGACAVSEDRPDLSCTDDNDCFQAQGETCDTLKKVCVGAVQHAAGPDAGAAIGDDPAVDDRAIDPAASVIGGAP